MGTATLIPTLTPVLRPLLLEELGLLWAAVDRAVAAACFAVLEALDESDDVVGEGDEEEALDVSIVTEVKPTSEASIVEKGNG